MKKVYLLTILIFAAAVNLSAARLPLPDIDIDEPAKPTASMSEEKNVLVQQQSSSFSAQDTLKPQESFNIPEIDVFKEENLGQSEFQSLEAPVSVDAAGAFGNLENLTKTLQANFQNAFSNIKSLTSKYNSLAARYQELVKKYNGDMKNVIQKAQII
ncbi:hypothetical protein KA977_05190, partial [Candidatus Dependentiae bacterium]|nr:hypothetical protein [Candidatus Dependentiae bacterium]